MGDRSVSCQTGDCSVSHQRVTVQSRVRWVTVQCGVRRVTVQCGIRRVTVQCRMMQSRPLVGQRDSVGDYAWTTGKPRQPTTNRKSHRGEAIVTGPEL